MAKAIVIGAGVGGLAAAVRLHALGYDVTVLEATDQPGGRASVFKRDGFVFDAGPTVITAPYLFEELFELVDKDPTDYYQLTPIDPFYRLDWPDGTVFDYVGDEARLLAQIRDISPRDVDGYLKLAEHSRRIFEIGYSKLAAAPFGRLTDMLRVIPDMLRLENHRSVYGLVSKYVKDEHLRQAFSFEPLLVGGNPFTTSSIYLLIHWLERKWGVHFAMGGTTSLIHGICRLLGDIGVDLQLSTPVEQITVSGGRATGVVTASGETLSADVVVSNADPSWTYRRMIDPKHLRRHRGMLGTKRFSQSMSLFVAYFGTTKTYPDLKHHTVVFGPRYKGLLDDIFKRKTLAQDMSLYLHAPTRTDPSLAPAGHENFYVLSPVPNNESGLDWDAIGDAYLQRVFDVLEERVAPGIRDHLATSFYITPNYFEQRLRSVSGAAFGPEPLLWQSAWFRYHNESEDVGGLYFVGAGTHPGGGLPGVLNTAKVLDKIVPRAPRAPGSRRSSRAGATLSA